MIPLLVLESLSQGGGQQYTSVALDVFPIAYSAIQEEKALIDGHVRVPTQIELSNTNAADAKSSTNDCVFVW
jgi:hypothetical protein